MVANPVAEETTSDGSFKRTPSSFRETISKTHPIYKPAANRYWLYVSLACPWAHRTLLARAIKGLTSVIGVSVVHWHMDSKGWRFLPSSSGNDDDNESGIDWKKFAYTANGGIENTGNANTMTSYGLLKSEESKRPFVDGTADPNYGVARLRDLYEKAVPGYTGRVTVPVLWDMETQTIVNNESAEIIRIFNSGVFDEFVSEKDKPACRVNLLPSEFESQIDEFNEWVYEGINNGVYKAGFATTGEAYEKAVLHLFDCLDRVEAILKKNYSSLKEKYPDGTEGELLQKYFTIGEQLTEADIRLYTTIVRFDPVYHQHFKCNLKDIRTGYPYIHKWLQNLFWNQNDAFRMTTNFDHIKLHYTRSHPNVNPLGITPLGPRPHILPSSL